MSIYNPRKSAEDIGIYQASGPSDLSLGTGAAAKPALILRKSLFVSRIEKRWKRSAKMTRTWIESRRNDWCQSVSTLYHVLMDFVMGIPKTNQKPIIGTPSVQFRVHPSTHSMPQWPTLPTAGRFSLASCRSTCTVTRLRLSMSKHTTCSFTA